MKRLLLSLLAASALALSMAGLASAEDGVIYKFECADITGGGGQLVDEDDPATAPYDFGFNLEAATKCGGMVYTLHVYGDVGRDSSAQIGERVGDPHRKGSESFSERDQPAGRLLGSGPNHGH